MLKPSLSVSCIYNQKRAISSLRFSWICVGIQGNVSSFPASSELAQDKNTHGTHDACSHLFTIDDGWPRFSSEIIIRKKTQQPGENAKRCILRKTSFVCEKKKKMPRLMNYISFSLHPCLFLHPSFRNATAISSEMTRRLINGRLVSLNPCVMVAGEPNIPAYYVKRR